MPTPALRLVFNRQALDAAVTTQSTDKYGKPCLLDTLPVAPGVVYELKSRYDGGGRLVHNGRTLAKATSCGSVGTKTNYWRHAEFPVGHKARFERHGVPFVEIAAASQACPEPV